jgi:hypothetical protein
MWAHRTQYRWYRPTELMTWTVMRRAMELGCVKLDLMGRGEFKPKLGAVLNEERNCWIWSRYHWLTKVRLLAGKGYKWQQGFRGRFARQTLFNRLAHIEPATPADAETPTPSTSATSTPAAAKPAAVREGHGRVQQKNTQTAAAQVMSR